MKEVNLLSITHAYNNIGKSLLFRYLDYFGISPKEDELKDLKVFTDILQQDTEEISVFDRYFLGYTIPQISKEFDLLRFGENSIINIELKRTCSEEKIIRQLTRNRYYLGFLSNTISSFCFVSNDKKLFRLDDNGDLEEIEFGELLTILQEQRIKEINDINRLFNPSNYLVSPFNATEEFVDRKYFLTGQQEEIKKKVLEEIDKDNFSFITISGKAGTGKTLLTYDIAKEYMSRKLNVLVIHCGILNDGHLELRDEYGWDIIPAKNTRKTDFSVYPLVIIDESQRIYPGQLDFIIEQVKANNTNCIFSYDQQQCLRRHEISNNIEKNINEKAHPIQFRLTEKIRTNKEIASFIRALLERNRMVEKLSTSNIELSYFKGYLEAKDYISLLKEKGWKVINYTPSRNYRLPYDRFSFFGEDNAHNVIGQEYDKVVAVVDSHFYYNGNRLSTRGYNFRPYYHPTKMLFQIMSRTRIKLSLVVINNNEIMERCLDILHTP